LGGIVCFYLKKQTLPSAITMFAKGQRHSGGLGGPESGHQWLAKACPLCADFVAKVGSADGLWVILFNGDRL